MDLVQLEIFRAIAQHNSVAAAASVMHRVPSNLTTRLKQLEEELGVQLFLRENNRLRLSQAGHSFLGYATRILDLVAEARQVAAGNEPIGRFALGSLESTAAVRIPPLLARYHQRYPKVELDLSTGPSGQMIDGVISGTLVAAFVDGPVQHPALAGMPVFTEEMLVIAPPGHGPILRGHDANGQVMYAFRDNCSYRHHFERWFASDQAEPAGVRELESYHSMLACISAGGGVAIIPRSMLETMPGRDLVSAWPLGEAFRQLSTWLIWRKDTRSQALEVFREAVAEFVEQHAELIHG